MIKYFALNNTHTHTHARTHAHTHTHTHARARARTHAHHPTNPAWLDPNSKHRFYDILALFGGRVPEREAWDMGKT